MSNEKPKAITGTTEEGVPGVLFVFGILIGVLLRFVGEKQLRFEFENTLTQCLTAQEKGASDASSAH